MSKSPVISTNQLIDLLASGLKLPEIARSYNISKYALERQMERLKTKHGCKTNVQLVVKLMNSGEYTMHVQPK